MRLDDFPSTQTLQAPRGPEIAQPPLCKPPGAGRCCLLHMLSPGPGGRRGGFRREGRLLLLPEKGGSGLLPRSRLILRGPRGQDEGQQSPPAPLHAPRPASRGGPHRAGGITSALKARGSSSATFGGCSLPNAHAGREIISKPAAPRPSLSSQYHLPFPPKPVPSSFQDRLHGPGL